MGIKILKFSLGKVLELKTYYYIPNIIRNIISIPLLLEQSFKIKAKNNGCSIYFFIKYYKNTYIDNDLLFLSLNDNILHVNNMKKRKRENVNIIYLWHCRLGHINELRINKLYKDKLFDSYDFESYGIYEFCLIRKMIKTPFTRYRERVSDIWTLYILMFVVQFDLSQK